MITSADAKRALALGNVMGRRLCRRDVPIDHVLCVTNSLELGEIAFRSTLTNNVKPLTRDLSRFRDDHNLPIYSDSGFRMGSHVVYSKGVCIRPLFHYPPTT